MSRLIKRLDRDGTGYISYKDLIILLESADGNEDDEGEGEGDRGERGERGSARGARGNVKKGNDRERDRHSDMDRDREERMDSRYDRNRDRLMWNWRMTVGATRYSHHNSYHVISSLISCHLISYHVISSHPDTHCNDIIYHQIIGILNLKLIF